MRVNLFVYINISPRLKGAHRMLQSSRVRPVFGCIDTGTHALQQPGATAGNRGIVVVVAVAAVFAAAASGGAGTHVGRGGGCHWLRLPTLRRWDCCSSTRSCCCTSSRSSIIVHVAAAALISIVAAAPAADVARLKLYAPLTPQSAAGSFGSSLLLPLLLLLQFA